MKIKDGLRFTDSEQIVIFNFHSWTQLLKGIIVKYAKKSIQEAEQLALTSPLICVPTHDYMSVVLRSHESEYHWAMLIVYGEGYWRCGISSREPDGYLESEKEYKAKNNLAQDLFEFID